MTNDTNITNDKDINANISHDDHFNDSIVNEEKQNRPYEISA